MYVFYEASILIGRLWNRRKRKHAARTEEAARERRVERARRRAAAAEDTATASDDTVESYRQQVANPFWLDRPQFKEVK